MISYLGSLVQFSPAAGRAGRCRPKSLCVGRSRRVLAKQPAVLGTTPWVRRAFSVRDERPGQPEACCAPSLRGPSALRRWGLRESSDRTRGLFAGWEGVASLGLSLPLSPPPASFLQRGWAGFSLEFLSPFVLRTAGGVFRPVNFPLLSHSLKELPPTALRAFGRSLP